ncbi:MAG: ABC transporter ATP-binding protein [Eubacteriaceae bacterium]|nr:ABC transporter ATP-binding protein [Eubacteriaceae bacterium]
MAKIIRTESIHKIYHVGETLVHALAGVSLSIEQGEFVAITGASGSGKSTLLNMLAGLEHVSSGQIIIGGVHLEDMSENELVTFRRDNVGFIFQSFNLISTLNAADNVALPLLFKGMSASERLKQAKEMLKIVGLGSHAGHKPMQMSGGQQQRVGIARALVVKPKIIFADEPTGNLDTKNSAEVMEILKKIVKEQNQTVVMVTHDMKLAAMSDRVIELSDGKIIRETIN